MKIAKGCPEWLGLLELLYNGTPITKITFTSEMDMECPTPVFAEIVEKYGTERSEEDSKEDDSEFSLSSDDEPDSKLIKLC